MLRCIYILSSFLAVILFSCNNMNKDGDNILAGNTLAKQMTGQWHTIGLHVEAKSWNNTDKDSIFDIPSTEFNFKLGFNKNIGTYKLDGSFEETYYSYSDSLLMRVTGNWDAKGDTVYVQQMSPSINENHYYFELKGDTGYFKTYLDWDKDGKKDDLFTSTALKKELPQSSE